MVNETGNTNRILGMCTFQFQFRLLVTCYLLSSQLGSKALKADIGPKVVQPVFEHINRWSTDNLLREPIPFTNRSLTEEEFSTVESASVDE